MKKNIIKAIKKDTVEWLKAPIDVSQAYLFIFLNILVVFSFIGREIIVMGDLGIKDIYIVASIFLFQIALATYIAFFKSKGIFSLPSVFIWSNIFTIKYGVDTLYFAYGFLMLGFIGHIYYTLIKKPKQRRKSKRWVW